MPRKSFTCPECGQLVQKQGHRWTKRCLLNQVDKLQSYCRFNDDRHVVRNLRRSELFLDFCAYLRSVLALADGHAASVVCSPAVPIPAATNASFRAFDTALMLGILKANMKRAGISVVTECKKGSVSVVTECRRHQLRVLAACMMIAFGFTTVWAAVVTSTFPDVPWSEQYGKDLRAAIEGAHAAGVQLMHTGTAAQSFRSIMGLTRAEARQPITNMIDIMKGLVQRVATIDVDELHERGASWAVTKVLCGQAYPRHGYTMCHGIQLAQAMQLFQASTVVDPKNQASTVVDPSCADWVPEGYGSNTCEAIAELTGEDVAPLLSSPALVCLRMTMLRNVVAMQPGLSAIGKVSNNEVKIQLCQWMKDEQGGVVSQTGVLTKGLTSKSAARYADSFVNKRKLHELVQFAIEEAADNKRRRLR